MPQDINFYSEEAQEILGKIPSWIIRWGITLIFTIFLIIIIGCCFIKYPERVNGTVMITTVYSPIDIVSKKSGNIEKMLVKNGDSIRHDMILGVIHSNADYKNILSVEYNLSQIQDSTLNLFVFEDWIYDKYNLGDLQNEWTIFSSACFKYQNYITKAVIEQKKKLLNEQISKQYEYYSQMKSQANILKKDSFTTQMTSTELSILQNRQQIIELSIQQDDEVLALIQDIEKSKARLLALIKEWKLSYLLTSPIDGFVSFVKKWDEGQFINVQETFLSVIPKKNSEIIGMIKVPQESFGKIKIGQKVNVRLNGYPYMEYGLLTGVVEYLSSVPENSSDPELSPQYTAEVIFPQGMRTSYGKDVKLIQKMNGEAEIITEERSLIMRFIDPVVSLFKSGI